MSASARSASSWATRSRRSPESAPTGTRFSNYVALFDTLIGDADGIYNHRGFNDRLLLGLK